MYFLVQFKDSETMPLSAAIYRAHRAPYLRIIERYWPLQGNGVKQIRLEYSQEKSVSP